MKTWLTLGLITLGCYLAYDSWFAPEDPTGAAEANRTADGEAAMPPAIEGSAPAETRIAERPPRLDLGGGTSVPQARGRPSGEEAAWELDAARRAAVRAGESDTARGFAQRILKEYPSSDPARWVLFERGRDALRRYERLGRNKEGLRYAQQARKDLTPALFLSGRDDAERDALRAKLTELAAAVLFTPRHVDGVDRLYVPKPGDSLDVLCRKVFPRWGARLSPGFVTEINGLARPEDLRAQEPIKVPLGEPMLIVAKHEFRLYFLLDGAYVRDFPVGLGREGSTPDASFKIVDKVINPDWYPSAGVKIPYGDPRNILGTRWLKFENTEDYRGFGIHGTADPDSIGREKSSGCVRMLREDVERLYAWTPRGTRVEIRP